MSVILSFIIPVYKPKSDVLEKCLVSLREQALKDWEAIIVLDGPCPEARGIVKKVFKKCDNTVQVIEIPHGGAPRARNEGAKVAIGKYWCFWDSDCVIEPGVSNAWVDLFERRPEVGFIYAGYKFFGDQYAIESERWDPFLLRVRNFISTCFPVRRELFDGWCEDLESLQDWDFWLSVVEKANKLGYDENKVGLYLKGYSFSTAMSDLESISGKGCKPEVWLDRMDAVRRRHGIEPKDICVTSQDQKHEGVKLAKLIGADYQDHPYDKPNRYKTIVQIGFNTDVNKVQRDTNAISRKDVKKVLFWSGENINQLYNGTSVRGMMLYRDLLNGGGVRQFVEDKTAERQMKDMGFNVEVLPLPLVNDAEQLAELPEKPRWIVDIAGNYNSVMVAVEQSLPDMELEVLMDGVSRPLSEYTGIISLFPDKSLSNQIKRAQLTGRHVISNVQQPFCGFVDESKGAESLIVDVVTKAREYANKAVNQAGKAYWSKALSPEKFLEVVRA